MGGGGGGGEEEGGGGDGGGRRGVLMASLRLLSSFLNFVTSTTGKKSELIATRLLSS